MEDSFPIYTAGLGVLAGLVFLSSQGHVGSSPQAADAATTQTTPNPNTFQPPIGYNQQPVVTAADKVEVSLADKTATLYQGGVPIKTYPIGIGAPGTPTPRGSFAVDEMEKNPVYISPSGREVPPGADNPLGSRWVRFTSQGNGDYGFHAGSVGTEESLGCVHLSEPDLQELYALVRPGTRVDVY